MNSSEQQLFQLTPALKENSGVTHLDNKFATNAKLSITKHKDLILLFLIFTKLNSKGNIATGSITLSELKNHFINKSSHSLRERINAAMLRLVKADFRMIPDKQNKTEYTQVVNIFDSLVSVKEGNQVTFKFQFTKTMTPFVLGLQGNFLTFNLPKGIDNYYALRFLVALKADYDKIKKHQAEFEYRIKLSRFRELLNLENKYPKFKDLRRSIIEPMIKEINLYDIIRIDDTEYLKTGKIVTEIKLMIHEGASAKTSQRQIATIITTDSIEHLSYSLYKAFTFLSEKGINHRIILNQIFKDIERMSSEYLGWEDLFCQEAWNCFTAKSKYNKKDALAGAFVKWWKNDSFQKNHFSEIMEKLQEAKKSKTEGEIDNRNLSKGRTYKEFVELINSTKL